MQRHSVLCRFLMVLLVIGAIGSCSKDKSSGPAQPVSQVVVEPGRDTLFVGEWRQFSATLEDADGKALSDRKVSWASSDSGVAQVDSVGMTYGVSPGQATIVASCEGKSGSATAIVVPVPVAAITVTPESLTVFDGESLQLEATVRDSAGNSLSGRTVVWASDDTTIARVSSSGIVTGVVPGATFVVVSCEAKADTAAVTVQSTPVDTVIVTPQNLTVYAGETYQLIAAVRSASGHDLSGRDISWSSADSVVARVSETGLVTGVSTGVTDVVASCEGHSDTSAVTVMPAPVDSVVVIPDSITLIVGESFQFSASPRDAAGNELTGRITYWSTDSTAVITISSSGLAYAAGPGTTAVTAICEGIIGRASVTVVLPPIASVDVFPDLDTLLIVDSLQYQAIVRDVNGNLRTDRPVVWSSSDTTVARISSSGVATGLALGSVAISAVCDGREGLAELVVTQTPTDVGGTISSNTTWTPAGSPYRLTADVQIESKVTLSIEEGVSIIGENKSIEAFGILRVRGTAEWPVVMSDVNIVPKGFPSQDSLDSLSFLIDLDHVEMHRGSLYAATESAIYGSLELRNSVLMDLNEYMYMWYPTTDCYIERNVFVNCGGISAGVRSPVQVYIRNNAFLQWTTPYAVENWISYGGETMVVEANSFLSTDRVAVKLKPGNPVARLTAVGNYWGTTDDAIIQQMIFDKNDDLGAAGYIEYIPFLTEPDPQTPSP